MRKVIVQDCVGEPPGLELTEAKPYDSGIVGLRYRTQAAGGGNGA